MSAWLFRPGITEPGAIADGKDVPARQQNTEGIEESVVVPEVVNESVESVIEDFSEWARNYIESSISQRKRLTGVGRELARARRESLVELIRTDPEAAISSALPYEVRLEMPGEIVALLEEPISTAGDYDMISVCFDALNPGGNLIRKAHVDGRTFDVFTYGERLEVTTKRGLSLHGIALDGAMALANDPVRVILPAERSARNIEATGLAV